MRKTARKIGISLDDFTKLFFERRFKRRAESHDLYFQEWKKRILFASYLKPPKREEYPLNVFDVESYSIYKKLLNKYEMVN